MKLRMRSLLGISVVITVYLIYLLGCADLSSRPGRGEMKVLPFFTRLSSYQIESLLNWTAFVGLVSWGTWAWKYSRDEE